MTEHCPCCPRSRAKLRKRLNGTGSVYWDAGRQRIVVAVSTPWKRLYAYPKSKADVELELSRLLTLASKLERQS